MVKTKGHYHKDPSMLQWYYDRQKQLQEKHTMNTLKDKVNEAKLDLLNKLNSLQREVIAIELGTTDRDMKNLNKLNTQANVAYNKLITTLDQL